tara:strand:- start:10875 stop:11711 length:837 start_codon:yes stop_codon:yes gene_type:complete
MKTPIQRILVPLDPSEYAKAATLRACQSAQLHQARVTGLTVLDVPGIRTEIAPADPVLWEFVEKGIQSGIEDAREKIGKIQGFFSDTCREFEVEHEDFSIEGVPSRLLLDASALHDLVVIGVRTLFHFETRNRPGNSLAKLLGRTATPILAVPLSTNESFYKKVVITYDGSMNAARTLRDFASFAAPFDFEITVVSAEDDSLHGEYLLHDASSYLHAHGFEQFDTVHVKKRSIPSNLLRDADLIVAGIHSKKFFKDQVIGSLTHHLIDRGDTALFLSH